MANQLSRRERESRAYTLTLVGGGAAVATVVLLVLGIVGIIGYGPAFLAAIVAAIAALFFRRTVGS